MTDPADPMPGSDLRLTGPHWTFIIRLYGDPDVQRACLLLQDGLGVDVSLLLTLVWYAAHGTGFDDGDVAALDQAITSWRSDVVKPLRTIRREIKPAAGHDAVVAGFRNKIKSVEIEAEQIEIALLMRAVDHRKRPGVSGAAAKPAPIARTVEMAVAFHAARAAVSWQTPPVRAAIKTLADAVARVSGTGRPS